MEKEILEEGGHCSTTQRDRKNERLINQWALAWVFTWMGATFGLKYSWLSGIQAVLVIIFCTALGVGTLMAYRHFLRDADELLRKIHYDAFAVSLGVTLVGGVAYTLLAKAGFVSEEGTTVTLLLMTGAYMISIVTGLRRYS